MLITKFLAEDQRSPGASRTATGQKLPQEGEFLAANGIDLPSQFRIISSAATEAKISSSSLRAARK
jgi:hypothetical protein